MASVLQYVEGLSDRQAADAVRGRIDWKYALGLELTDPGFDHTVLSEFRSRLVHGQAEQQLLDTLLDRCRELGLIRERGRQRTDSTHVLAAVRVLNRLERVGETMRAALNELAVMAPDWLQALAPAEWYRRYGRRVENYHLPKTDAAREELARVIAADGERLLAAVDAATRSARAGAAPGGGDLAPRLGRAVHGRAGPVALARGQGHALAGGIDQLALRHRRPLQHQARGGMGGVQGAPDRDVRRGSAAPDRQRRDDARDDAGR